MKDRMFYPPDILIHIHPVVYFSFIGWGLGIWGCEPGKVPGTIHKSIQEQPDDSCRQASLENLKRLYTLDERAKARKKSMQEELDRLEGIYSDTYK